VQAKVTGNLVYSSGQIPINPATGNLVEGGIEEQTKRVCENLKAVLEAAGSSLTKVVKTNCYLKDINDFAAFNAVYAEYFTEKPARSCVGGLQIPKGALVEVEVIAEL
ncbi:MAG: Rid family detoxifying hydrolase, partial [Oscillospiraceae bacterium]